MLEEFDLGALYFHNEESRADKPTTGEEIHEPNTIDHHDVVRVIHRNDGRPNAPTRRDVAKLVPPSAPHAPKPKIQ